MMNKYRNGLEQNQRDRRTTLGILCGKFALCVEVLDKARPHRMSKLDAAAHALRRQGKEVWVWQTLPDDRVRHHPAPVVNTNRCVSYTEAPMIADIHAALDRTGMSPGSVRT